MDAAPLTDEEQAVIEWHHERMRELGVTDNADLIALADVDWHRLEALLAARCPLAVAIEILS